MNEIKTAVVIGGTGGLGLSMALSMAEKGVKVTVFGRSIPGRPMRAAA